MNIRPGIIVCLLLLSIAACDNAQTEGSDQQASAPAESAAPAAASAAPEAPLATLNGYYVGEFVADKMDEAKQPMYSNKINVSIDSVLDDKIQGHSVVAGNSRPFSGSIVKTAEGRYAVKAKEPGDDQYDGAFNFELDAQNHKIKGSWLANNQKLAVPSRTYELDKKAFKYDPGNQLVIHDKLTIYGTEGVNPNGPKAGDEDKSEAVTPDAAKFNASTTALKPADIENMFKRDLEIMRNAIYARHGYSFKNRQMRDFFDHQVEWYVPVSTDVTKDLTPLEQQNIALLKRYENHAAAYYDRFGR